ncbi:Tctex1 domain-containing protein 2-like, partial [Scleropages formosus]
MEKNETMERNTYIIGPDPQRKFKAAVAKECIRQIIGEAMTGRQYNPQEIPSLSRSLADSIKDKLKEAGFDRYKLVVQGALSGRQYEPQEVPFLSRSLADSIKEKVKETGLDRYKLVVQVVIGEQRGEGVKMAARCFWDADTDSYAQDVYMNSILCGRCIRLLLLLRRDRLASRRTDRPAAEDGQQD